MTPFSSPLKPGLVWMRQQWGFGRNPFPASGVAVLGGQDKRENGLLFEPAVQREKVQEAIEKYVLGAAYGSLKFGYLWSLGGRRAGDVRGFGKSVLLQYLVHQVNLDFARRFQLECGLDEADAEEHPLCATIASFDMANARSLAAVFFEATRYACREKIGDEPTLASRLHSRLVERLGTNDPGALAAAVVEVGEGLMGRTIGPAVGELIAKLCAGDSAELNRFIEAIKSGARGRVSAANYFATFLLFAKAAGVSRVLLGCDQLEDFAATTTSRQKRGIEVERFRDFVMELQPMADMLSVVVTLHPRAQATIHDLWRLADLPDFAPDRVENQSRVVVLTEIDTIDRAKALLLPYLREARIKEPPVGDGYHPFTNDAIEVLLSRSDGKPRDILRKANVLIDHGSSKNWSNIDGRIAASILDSITIPDEDIEYGSARVVPQASLEETWIA